MKSLSCTTLSRPNNHPAPTHRLQIPIDTYKDDNNNTIVPGHNGSKLRTIIEVLKCEMTRPGYQKTTARCNRLAPSKGWTPLHYAAHHNREAALVHYIRTGHSLDGSAGSKESPLCIAVAAGHTQIVKLLCQGGADVNYATQDKGETALHIALKNGRTDIVEILLSYGPGIEIRTKDTYETPLHYAAAKTGSLAAVVTLLKSGADYEARDHSGYTPAEVAIRTLNIHAAVAIISSARGKRKKLIKEKDMLLRHVENAQNRYSMTNELISALFEASCDPDSTILVEAIKRDDLSLARMFLEKGADPNRATTAGLRPIFVAIGCSSAKMVQLLVKHKVDVTVRDPDCLNVLQAALESPLAHDKEAVTGIFESLLSRGADANILYPDGKTLLHHAVGPGLGLSMVAQMLLQHGVGVNKADNSGCTALHLSAQNKSCIEVLLRNGADTRLVNCKGLTPLLSAITLATKETEPDVEPLVKASNLCAQNPDKKTALHIAAERGLERTVKLLLNYRAETTSTDYKARTPLLLAVLHQQWAIVPLLATQPGVNTWDKEGMTALHHAAKSIPQFPATWNDISLAVTKFCERGASRSMRNRLGATPLIQAVKTLPEEGLPVVEVLLKQGSGPRSNCIDHEDHKQRSALYYSATLGKPSFVKALLMQDATFRFKDWTPAKGPLQPNTDRDRQTLKLFAENEWLRRSTELQTRSASDSTEALLKILPLPELRELLIMGLDPNALPFPSKSTYSGLLLWLILNQTQLLPPLPLKYLYDLLKLIFSFGADPNATMVHSFDTLPLSNSASRSRLHVGCHPLAFLLEQYLTVDIDLVTLFLDNGSNLSIPSLFYEGRFPLHSAVKANRIDVVDEFVSRKADVDATDLKGRTALFIAAENGFWEILDLLLQSGARIETVDIAGYTPLHIAAFGGSSRIVSRLLQAGAKALATTEKGSTPRSLVPDTPTEKEKNEIIALLKNTEEQERVAEERKRDQLKREAIEEGKRTRQRELEEQRLREMKSKSPRAPPRMTIATSPISLPQFTKHVSPLPENTYIIPLSKTTAQPAPNPDQTSSSTSITPKPEKPLPTPRIDSGFGFAQAQKPEKLLPILDRNRNTFDSTSNIRDGEDDTEIMNWLTISRAIHRL